MSRKAEIELLAIALYESWARNHTSMKRGEVVPYVWLGWLGEGQPQLSEARKNVWRKEAEKLLDR